MHHLKNVEEKMLRRNTVELCCLVCFAVEQACVLQSNHAPRPRSAPLFFVSISSIQHNFWIRHLRFLYRLPSQRKTSSFRWRHASLTSGCGTLSRTELQKLFKWKYCVTARNQSPTKEQFTFFRVAVNCFRRVGPPQHISASTMFFLPKLINFFLHSLAKHISHNKMSFVSFI